MKRTRDFNISEINPNTRLIVYGAGRYGELAYWGLKSLGVSIDFFMDKNRVGEELLGISIISPSKISKYSEDTILIASYNYYNEILEFLIANKVKNIFNISTLLELDYDVSTLSEYLRDEKCNCDKYRNVIENESSNNLIINHCELVVTEKCTLRCKNCANLMQYYSSPQDAEDVELEAFDRFIESIDRLLEWRILGGEPFCYSRLAELIDRYASNPKILRTTIYTNSTLIPSETVLNSIKNNDVVIHMSNYGVISSKLKQLDMVLSEKNIKHYIHDYDMWKNLGGTENRNYSEAKIASIYDNCVMATCYTFHSGKFWICPRAAHGDKLGFFREPEEEYVDYLNCADVLYNRERLRVLLTRREPIEACKFCDGFGKNTQDIKAAEQKQKGMYSIKNWFG